MKAKPGILEYQQPDGSMREIMLHGDERMHYATDPKGNLLVADGRGGLVEAPADFSVEAVKVASRFIKAAGADTRSGDPKYRYSTSAFPTVGTPHSLVILVEYPDHGFNVEDPLDYFDDFLNGDDFSRDGATGSCRRFYTENSRGAFSPTFDVYGPVMMKNRRSYYGGGYEDNACQMVVEAVEALDATVDFSRYDHNEDGYVDSVYIIYADRGEADGGPSESVWPYSWELELEDVFLEADGVKFNTYGCSNELKKNGKMEGIGTFTHEFGHVLGLPDLYNTYNSYDKTTPCSWSLMDSGSYNDDCRTPCNLSAFERYSLGWLSPLEILSSGNFVLPEMAGSNRAFILTTEENPDEFFILENRRLAGWDSFLPAEGMLVWHIDFRQKAWDDNTVNNSRSHHLVELVRADDTTGAASYAGDPFPGANNVNRFSTATTPALASWAGTPLNVTNIYDINDPGDGNIYFSALATQYRGETGKVDAVAGCGFRLEGSLLISDDAEVDAFDMMGRKVGTASPGKSISLPRGIYIIQGNKFLVTD